MKRITNFLKIYCIKMFLNPAFIVAVLATIILLLTTSIFVDNENGRVYTLLDVVFLNNRKTFIELAGLNWNGLFLRENSGYLIMFIPIISAMTYISVNSTGNINSNFRFEIYRISKKIFVVVNLFSAMIVGGVVVVTAYLIYGILLYAFIGNGIDVSIQKNIIKLMIMFIYGAISVLPAYFMHIFIKNKYVVLCVPFMTNYIMILLWAKILPKISSVNIKAAVLMEVFLPSNLQKTLYLEWRDLQKYIFFYLALIVFVLVINYINIERRCDCGGR